MTDSTNFNPMYSRKLFGYNNYFNIFNTLILKKKFPKVVMLSGEKGSGKFTMAFHLINYVLSQGSEYPYNYENKIINNKNTFYNDIISNISQNYHYLSGEDNSTKIDDIRNVKKKFNNTLLNNLPRFIIIDDVEVLNIYTVNSLLKLIEEPTKTNFFILINNKRQKIIDTIQSRSIEFKFFLDSSSKTNILKELIQNYDLKDHFIFNYKDKLTPGNLVRFYNCLNNLAINEETSLHEKADILLEKYKKTKQEIFLSCLIFFIQIKSVPNSNKSKAFLKYVNNRYKIINLLSDYKKYNLTNNIILHHLKKTENLYAK